VEGGESFNIKTHFESINHNDYVILCAMKALYCN
jgi:hypothetical protein